MKKYFKDIIFELTAPEGSEYTDFKVNRWGTKTRGLITYYGQKDKRKTKSVYVYVNVIGLQDKKCKKRNWWSLGKKLDKL